MRSRAVPKMPTIKLYFATINNSKIIELRYVNYKVAQSLPPVLSVLFTNLTLCSTPTHMTVVPAKSDPSFRPLCSLSVLSRPFSHLQPHTCFSFPLSRLSLSSQPMPRYYTSPFETIKLCTRCASPKLRKHRQLLKKLVALSDFGTYYRASALHPNLMHTSLPPSIERSTIYHTHEYLDVDCTGVPTGYSPNCRSKYYVSRICIILPLEKTMHLYKRQFQFLKFPHEPAMYKKLSSNETQANIA